MATREFQNYHMILAPDRSACRDDMTDEEHAAATVWTCDYCGKRGTFDEMRRGDCTFAYEPCKHCGGREGSNECRLDCKGIAEILSSPEVYIAGMIDSDVKA